MSNLLVVVEEEEDDDIEELLDDDTDEELDEEDELEDESMEVSSSHSNCSIIVSTSPSQVYPEIKCGFKNVSVREDSRSLNPRTVIGIGKIFVLILTGFLAVINTFS